MKKRLLIVMLVVAFVVANGNLAYAEEEEVHDQIQKTEEYNEEPGNQQLLIEESKKEEDSQLFSTEEIVAPMVTDVKLIGVEDKDNLSAPVSFQVQLMVKAPEGQRVDHVKIEYMGTTYGQIGYGEINKSERHFGLSEPWEPGIEGDTCMLDVSFGEYGPINEYRIMGISLSSYEHDSIADECYVSYSGNGAIEDVQSLQGSYVYNKNYQVDKFGDLPDLPISEENIRITSSKKTDTIKPQITSITPKEKVTSTDTIQGIEVGYKDMDSGIKQIHIIYCSGKNDSWAFQVGWTADGDSYIGKGEIIVFGRLQTGEDSFYLYSIDVTDNAGNNVTYYRDDNNQLTAKEYNPSTGEEDVIYTLDGAETGFLTKHTSEVFDGPILTYANSMMDEVVAPGVLQCAIKVSDESNLDAVKLCCVTENGKKVLLESEKITKPSSGAYICSFPLDKYSEEGDYWVSDLYLIDNSEGEKVSSYWTSEDNPTVFRKAGTERQGNMNFTVTRSNKDMLVSDIDNVTSELDRINVGGTVVIKDINYDEQVSLSQKIIETAIQKSLEIVILDENRNSEIVVEGEDLKDISGNGELELKVQRNNLVKDTISVGEKEDDMYYPVRVTASDVHIPVKIRVKVDKKFKEARRGNPIHISRLEPDNNLTVLYDNIRIDNEGYVELTFDNGLNSKRNASNEEIQFIISSKENETRFALGDIDNSGKVAMSDLLMCLYHVSGRTELTGNAFVAADINDDGVVKMTDLLQILHYVSGRDTEL